MRGPLQRLATLPWLTLWQNALLTVVIAIALDILLLLASYNLWLAIPGSGRFLSSGGLFRLLLSLLAAAGIGALAVMLMERFFSHTRLDSGTLWALVGCLALLLYGYSLLPLPRLLVGFSYPQFVGLLLGLFSKGRRHWRW
jgi:hypothetical protein